MMCDVVTLLSLTAVTHCGATDDVRDSSGRGQGQR